MKTRIHNLTARLPGEISNPQALVLGVLLVAGLVVAFAVPIGGGFDEIQHLRRAWEMSAYRFLPNSGLGEDISVPVAFQALSYRERPIVEQVGLGYWRRYADLRLDSMGWGLQGASTRSVYSPALLLPQSLVLRYMGRKLDVAFLWTLLAMRVSGLLVYIILAALAVRLVPYGKWAMLAMAALPTGLFQASTLTADAISTGLALLFLAGSLRIAQRPRLGRSDCLLLIALAALLFLAKANLAPLVLVPLFLIGPSRYPSRRAYVTTIAAIICLFVILVAGWYLVAYPAQGVMISQTPPLEHLRQLARRPLKVVGGLLTDLGVNGVDYLKGWIAGYGYHYWPVPVLSYLLPVAAIVLIMLSNQDAAGLDGRTRRVLLVTWLVTYATTAVLVQVISVDPGSGQVRELQGRYFSGAMPLIGLAAAGLTNRRWAGPRPWILASLIAASVLIFALGGILAYHVDCGPSYYNFTPCVMPTYKNYAPWDHPTEPVTRGAALRQEIIVKCSNFSEIRLWVDSTNGGSESTRFGLRPAGADEYLLDTTLANNGLPRGDWLQLRFDPQPGSSGELYQITVEGSGDGPGGITLGQTVRPEYEQGQLYQAGQMVDQDLFFQYGCKVGPRVLWGR